MVFCRKILPVLHLLLADAARTQTVRSCAHFAGRRSRMQGGCIISPIWRWRNLFQHALMTPPSHGHGPETLSPPRLLHVSGLEQSSAAGQTVRRTPEMGSRGDMGEPIGQAGRGLDEIRPMLTNGGGHTREWNNGHLIIEGLLQLLGLGLGLIEQLVPVFARVPVAQRIFRLANLRVGKLPSRLLPVGLHATRLRTPPLPCYTLTDAMHSRVAC